MYVSGSILAVKKDYQQYAKLLKRACVDYIHIDIFQNSTQFPLKNLKMFKENDFSLDLHLIYKEISDKDIEVINLSKAKFVNIQYETLTNKTVIKELAKKIVGNFGIALTIDTSLDAVDKNINYISQVLIMCSQPGISGAPFNIENYKRIEQIHDKYPNLKIWVDGGIDNVIAEKLGKLKVDVLVSGSYLCRNLKQIYSLTYKLKYLNEKNVKVTRNMLHLNELPIAKESSKFTEIMFKMNNYRMGTVLIVKHGELRGIITDGDIRRGLMKYGKDIFEKKAFEFMNKFPLIIEADKTMEEVFEILTQKQKRTDFIPITENGKLVGAIDLHIGL